MRVCHVVRQYAPGVGGLESFVAMLARELSEQGCVNEVLTLDRLFHDHRRRLPALEQVGGIRVRRAPMVGHPRFFLPLIEQDALAGYDVIHVHGIDGMFDRVARQRRRCGQSLVATSHGLFFHTPWMQTLKHLYLNTATRLAAAQYDLLIANSLSDKTKLRVVSDNVVHLPNGVSALGAFQAGGGDVLCLGRLAEHKHVYRVVAAFAEPELINARLHIVGPEWGVSYLDIARVAELLGVSDRVLLHGRVDGRRLGEIAKSCGVYVSASTYEGFGMSLIEAMSVGLVPVVQPNAAFAELIGAANVGALTDFARPNTAARAIRRQLDMLDPAQRREARAFSTRFSWSGHAKRTRRLYRMAARNSARATR
jgi:alpha-1,3-mannosyltransferase